MVMQRIHSTEEFIGTSLDDKPSSAMVGSTFYEYDTSRMYIVASKTNGIANWVLRR